MEETEVPGNEQEAQGDEHVSTLYPGFVLLWRQSRGGVSDRFVCFATRLLWFLISCNSCRG